MKTSLLKSIAVFVLTIATLTTYADQKSGGNGMDMGGMKMDCKGKEHMKGMKMNCMENNSTTTFSMADGVVEDVDKKNKSVVLKHGPIKSKTIEMGPMTMPFNVKDASLLSQVKVGDKVKFNAENVDGVATVTSLKVRK